MKDKQKDPGGKEKDKDRSDRSQSDKPAKTGGFRALAKGLV